MAIRTRPDSVPCKSGIVTERITAFMARRQGVEL